MGRRGVVVREPDARPEGREFESRPSRDMTCACVPDTLPQFARVFSDMTLKIVGPFYLVSVPVKDPTLVI